MAEKFNIEDGILVSYEGDEAVVQIPNGVIEIGAKVFEASKKITEVIMPDSLLKINSEAFYKCPKLKNIVFSNSLEEIGYKAFAGCKALTEIVLPDSLKEASGGCFAGCENLKKATCNPKNFVMQYNPFTCYGEKEVKGLIDENGFLIFADVLYQYTKDEKEIIVPEGVKQIFSGAFKSDQYSWGKKRQVEKIVLPSTVHTVGREAFAYNKQLKTIEISSSIKFGEFAFSGCESIADENGFFIYDGVLHAYFGNSDTVIVPDGIKEIAPYVFRSAQSVHKVVLPDGLEVIGSNAFENCDLLESITIPESVHTIGNTVFKGCDHLIEVKLPENVENMGDGIFLECRGLADKDGFIIQNNVAYSYYGVDRDVTVPEGVKYISAYLFNGEKMETISLPSTLKVIGNGAFAKCEFLKEITIPENVTELPSSCFESCKNLEKVEVPSTLSKIGYSAFNECSSLKEMIIPESVEQIGSHAFYNCRAMEKVQLPKNLKEISVCTFSNCESLKEVSIPNTVKKVGSSAFSNCTSLEKLEIPTENIELAATTFEGCEKLVDENGMLIVANVLWKYSKEKEELVVPEGVVKISSFVFWEGYQGRRNLGKYRSEGTLKKVSLPSTLKEIGMEVFHGCEGLKEIVIPEGLEVIGNAAFSGCKELVKINIPASVKSIGKQAFIKCSALQEIVVAENNPYYESIDGILFDKSGQTLLCFPGGSAMLSYTIPEQVRSIADYAFSEARALKKIVIPATVENIGSYVFPRSQWHTVNQLKSIVVDPKAGSGIVGQEIFDFDYKENVLVYPTLPLSLIKESEARMRLAFGYCLNPDKYEGEYAETYKKYANSYKKSLIKKATQLKVPNVEAYYGASTEEAKDSTYKPNLKIKKASELAKVELLEEVVLKGTLQDLKDVLKTYKTFEITARALALAGRYRGVDFVEALLEHGAKFTYESTTAIQRKYRTNQQTASGNYKTEYALMIVPDKLKDYYGYSPMTGVSEMIIPKEYEEKVLPVKDRIEVAKCFMKYNIAMDELLFWALTHGNFEFADALIAMGVDLNKIPPTYYTSWGDIQTYLEMVTEGGQTTYWNAYVSTMSALDENKLYEAFVRFDSLAKKIDKQLVLSQKMFDDLKWNDDSLAFVFKHANLGKINQKKTLELAVKRNAVGALKLMAEEGWLSNSTKRENIIKFAQENACNEALAWLIDFKNRTVDLVKEAEKEEAKLFKELIEDPNSVSALKKKWSYKKLEDGTLEITKYKGEDVEVEIPEKIGKAMVSSIGEDAFSCSEWLARVTNLEVRKNITSVIIPEGIKTIGATAFFGCQSLESIKIPASVTNIHMAAFRNCYNLREVLFLGQPEYMGVGIFGGCSKLEGKEGFTVIDGILFGYTGQHEILEIPEGVRVIAAGTFKGARYSGNVYKAKEIVLSNTLEVIGENAFEGVSNLKEIVIPVNVKVIKKEAFMSSGLEKVTFLDGVSEIGEGAFKYTKLTEIRIPKSVKTLRKEAFYRCESLRDLYISEETTEIEDNLLGTDGNTPTSSWSAYKPNGVYVHTPENSVAAEYMKRYSGVHVANDYSEE